MRRVGWYLLQDGLYFHGTLPEGAVEVDPPAVGLPDRPSPSASKAVWVDYASTVGVDVTALSKAAIVAAVDEFIDAGNSSSQVRSDVTVDESDPDASQVVDSHVVSDEHDFHGG